MSRNTNFQRAHADVREGIFSPIFYLAWVIFPDVSKQGEKRTRLVKALVNLYLRKMGKHSPELFKGMRSQDIDGTIDDAFLLLDRHRLTAAYVAVHRLKGIAATDIYDHVRNNREACRNWSDDYFKKVWRQSRPALAMTLPIFYLLHSHQRIGIWGEQSGYEDLVLDPSWVRCATACAPIVANDIQAKLCIPRLLMPRLVTKQELEEA